MADKPLPLAQVSAFGLDFEDEPEYGSVVVTRSGGNGQWLDGWRRDSGGWCVADAGAVDGRRYDWEYVSATNERVVVGIFRPGRAGRGGR
jgi:hypothetical protein